MLRATILFAVGLCANVLIGLPGDGASAGRSHADTHRVRHRRHADGRRPAFTDTFAYKDLKLTFAFSRYLIKHGDEYMVWGHRLRPRHESQRTESRHRGLLEGAQGRSRWSSWSAWRPWCPARVSI
jgi:hypothetical protein